MMSRLTIGTVLKEQYEIAQVFGGADDRAAYLALDLFSLERVLVWESVNVFHLNTRPPGIREYFQEQGHSMSLCRAWMAGMPRGYTDLIAGVRAPLK